MESDPEADTQRPVPSYADRFRPRKFADDAADVIREMILSRQIRPGERVNELALAEDLQISRSPIREALNALAGEGLVEFVPGRGAFVPEFSVAKVERLGEVRQALECLGARLAAVRATPAQLSELREMLDRAASGLRDQPEMYPVEIDFHLKVLIAADNPDLLQVATGIIRQLRLARLWSGQATGRARAAHDEHIAIVDALVRRDPAAAEQAMREHLAHAVASARHVAEPNEGPAVDPVDRAATPLSDTRRRTSRRRLKLPYGVPSTD